MAGAQPHLRASRGGRQIRAVLLSRFVGQTLRTSITSENHEDLIVLTGLIGSYDG
jgi:hypothetical protein